MTWGCEPSFKICHLLNSHRRMVSNESIIINFALAFNIQEHIHDKTQLFVQADESGHNHRTLRMLDTKQEKLMICKCNQYDRYPGKVIPERLAYQVRVVQVERASEHSSWVS